MKTTFIVCCTLLFAYVSSAQSSRLRELGVEIGVLPTGENNAITDVPGVTVGHVTLIQGENIRTGVTAIVPHQGNLYQEKVPAAIYIGNGYGKLMGYSQVRELGEAETPIILTNTLSVPTAANGLISYTLNMQGNESVRSVNALVGETNDGYLNDIRGRHVTEAHVLEALNEATSGPVAEGNVGAGTGTICFGYKGGIGTSSRLLPEELGGYTVGVLVQTNFGGVLEIAGVPVGKELGKYPYKQAIDGSADGSCMMVVITNAPLDARNLERLAKRAMLGLAKTGGIASNGSGDYVIALSTHESVRIKRGDDMYSPELIPNSKVTPLFLATIEATEEAILNSLFAADTMQGLDGREIQALPREEIMDILRRYSRINE